MATKTYYGKLLLFGEYTIIKGGKALALPLRQYQGQWAWQTPNEPENNLLRQLLGHVQMLNSTEALAMNAKAFEADLDKGLYFDSSIPQGFGAGSSGALCAALYERYGLNIIPKNNHDASIILQLKQDLAQLENYFHGASSGIDPLICYLENAVLLRSKTEAEVVQLPKKKTGDVEILLLNTKIARQTAPLVTIFLENCKDVDFDERCKTELCLYSDACITAFLEGNQTELWKNIALVSAFQMKYFKPMIPEKYQAFWEKGLKTKTYYMKLCGAGGGGFILVFTKNKGVIEKELGQIINAM